MNLLGPLQALPLEAILWRPQAQALRVAAPRWVLPMGAAASSASSPITKGGGGGFGGFGGAALYGVRVSQRGGCIASLLLLLLPLLPIRRSRGRSRCCCLPGGQEVPRLWAGKPNFFIIAPPKHLQCKTIIHLWHIAYCSGTKAPCQGEAGQADLTPQLEVT